MTSSNSEFILEIVQLNIERGNSMNLFLCIIRLFGKDVRANVNNHVNAIDLNMFVHNSSMIVTDTTVLKTIRIFSPLLNYIFDVLLIE